LLDNVTQDNDFALLMQKHIEDMIIHFFDKEQNFGILCKIDDVEFNPALPQNLSNELRHLTLFFLAGYTFESAHLEGDYLIFEAGFGAENFGSVVSVPLSSIMQIIVDETPILINLSNKKPVKKPLEQSSPEKGIENSMASFLSNPENSKFIKK
jgi:hypothetical protein